MIPGGSEWLIILVVVILLFGAKKIPELASGLGKGLKEFKKAQSEDNDSQIEDASSEDGKKGQNEESGGNGTNQHRQQ